MRNDYLQRYMNVGFGARLTAFLAATLLMAVVAGVIAAFFLRAGMTTPKMRIVTVLQDVLMMIVPPVLAAVISTRLPARMLLLDRPRGVMPFVLVVAGIVVSIPAMNRLVAINEAMSLPAALSGLESWMRTSETQAADGVAMLMGGGSVGDLVMGLLIMGLLAGFSEELFFRGGLQQLLITKPMNAHAAIWITAAVFSAIHLQFFGFFPRLLLGAWFGYVAWWSGTLWVPVAAHVLNNCAVVTSTWLNTRYGVGDALQTAGAEGSDWLVGVSLVLTVIVVVAMRRACLGGMPGAEAGTDCSRPE